MQQNGFLLHKKSSHATYITATTATMVMPHESYKPCINNNK